MISIQLCSDAHLEFDKRGLFQIPFHNENILILPGDVQVGLDKEYWFADLLEHRDVLYCLGNHEFYGEDLYDIYNRLPFFEIRVNEIAEAKGYEHKLYCFQNRALDYKGYKFIGGTMWTDFKKNDPICKMNAAKYMTDYSVIKNCKKKLTPDDIYGENQRTIKFIADELAKDEGIKKIVFTHHLPSYGSVAPIYRNIRDEVSNPFYYSDFDNIAEMADFWFHGHTHESCDYMINNCRVVCNPRGYNSPGYLNPNFKTVLIDI